MTKARNPLFTDVPCPVSFIVTLWHVQVVFTFLAREAILVILWSYGWWTLMIAMVLVTIVEQNDLPVLAKTNCDMVFNAVFSAEIFQRWRMHKKYTLASCICDWINPQQVDGLRNYDFNDYPPEPRSFSKSIMNFQLENVNSILGVSVPLPWLPSYIHFATLCYYRHDDLFPTLETHNVLMKIVVYSHCMFTTIVFLMNFAILAMMQWYHDKPWDKSSIVLIHC